MKLPNNIKERLFELMTGEHEIRICEGHATITEDSVRDFLEAASLNVSDDGSLEVAGGTDGLPPDIHESISEEAQVTFSDNIMQEFEFVLMAMEKNPENKGEEQQ